jgi:hypothetical protein
MNRILIIVAVTFLALACKKKATVWDTDWNLPLINDTLFVDDFVNDSTIQEDPGGYYVLGMDRTLFEFGINDFVGIPDTTIQEQFTLAVPSITIAPGFSFVNSTEEHELLLNDIQLKKILLKKGNIEMTVKNPIETKAIFTVQLPGVEKDGVPFSYTFTAPAATNTSLGITSQLISLEGYEIDLSGIAGIGYNTLQSNITVTSDPLGPSVTMTSSDVTIVDATFKDVQLDYAQGYFKYSFSDSIQRYFKELDIYNSGILDLPSTSVSFEVENGMKVGAEGLLTFLNGTNSAGDLIGLFNSQVGSSFNIDPATGSWGTLTPSLKMLNFNTTNSNIADFIENLPSSFNLGYSIDLNPWGNISSGWDEVFPNSRLKLGLKVDMPLMVGMNDLALRDTFALSLEQDFSSTHVESGRFILDLDNAFPIGGEVQLMLLDENDQTLEVVSGSTLANAGQFGQYDALTDLFHANSTVYFELNESAVSKLNQLEKVIVHVKMNTTDPISGTSQQMMIPIGAYLGIKLRAEFKTKNMI